MSIHIYLYALQNVFPMEGVLQMPWVHELLNVSNHMMMKATSECSAFTSVVSACLS